MAHRLPRGERVRRKRGCFVGCSKCWASYFYVTVVIILSGLRSLLKGMTQLTFSFSCGVMGKYFLNERRGIMMVEINVLTSYTLCFYSFPMLMESSAAGSSEDPLSPLTFPVFASHSASPVNTGLNKQEWELHSLPFKQSAPIFSLILITRFFCLNCLWAYPKGKTPKAP